MNFMKQKNTAKNGFTLVELMIVIAVIGILVGITIVSYGAWKNTAIANTLKSDLSNVATSMESYRNFNNVYPTSIPTTFTPAPDDTMTGGSTDGGITYCITATSIQNTSISYYISSQIAASGAQVGTCASRAAIPSAPSNLIASVVSSTVISLTWNASTGTVTTYLVQRAAHSDFSDAVTDSQPTGTSTNSSGLTPNTTYYYRVQASNNSGTSGWSNSVSMTTGPLTPTNFTAATTSTTQVTYSWTASSGASSYTMLVATDSAFSNVVQTINTASTSGTLTLSPSTTYYLEVEALNSSGTASGYTTSLTETTYTNWGVYSILTGVGDWNGDGNNDIIAYNPTLGVFDLHLGHGNGTFGPAIKIYTPGTTVVNIIGPGILSGQTAPIVMWTQSSSGTPGYYLQSNGSTGISGSAVSTGTNYASYTSIFAAPKFYTGKAPFWIGQTSSLYEEQLASSGTSTTLLNYGSGWSSSYPGNNTFGVGDFNGDGIGDIAGISSSGAMTIYPGTGTGTTGTTFTGGSGWLNNYVTGGWDYNNDGHPDILRLNTSGVLQLYEGSDTSGGTLAWYLNGGIPYTVN
jgi:prepilin-type N-terminal cleavage/methylation domain-containing protein